MSLGDYHRKKDYEFMIEKIQEYMTQPCPECEKHKRAIDRMIQILDQTGIDCFNLCPIEDECSKSEKGCPYFLRKWAYEEGE